MSALRGLVVPAALGSIRVIDQRRTRIVMTAAVWCMHLPRPRIIVSHSALFNLLFFRGIRAFYPIAIPHPL